MLATVRRAAAMAAIFIFTGLIIIHVHGRRSLAPAATTRARGWPAAATLAVHGPAAGRTPTARAKADAASFFEVLIYINFNISTYPMGAH